MNYVQCSHSRVTRKTVEYPGGYQTEFWQCQDCETLFCPENTDQAGRRLRDWFAGMALNGLLAQGFMPYQAKVDLQENGAYTKAAVILADQLVKELDKPAGMK